MIKRLFNWFSKKARDIRKFQNESQVQFHFYINNGILIVDSKFGDFKPSNVADVSDYIALYLANLSSDYRQMAFMALMDKANGNQLLNDTLQISAEKLKQMVGEQVSSKPKRSMTPFNAKI